MDLRARSELRAIEDSLETWGSLDPRATLGCPAFLADLGTRVTRATLASLVWDLQVPKVSRVLKEKRAYPDCLEKQEILEDQVTEVVIFSLLLYYFLKINNYSFKNK
jgi:hypothetical protein